MMIKAKFGKLKVWQIAKDLSVDVYRVARGSNLLSRDFRLKDQMCAAAVSIASNIAEGEELYSNKQSIRHFYIAKGSAAELMTQLTIASEIGYIAKSDQAMLMSKCEHVSAMLQKSIIARSPDSYRDKP